MIAVTVMKVMNELHQKKSYENIDLLETVDTETLIWTLRFLKERQKEKIYEIERLNHEELEYFMYLEKVLTKEELIEKCIKFITFPINYGMSTEINPTESMLKKILATREHIPRPSENVRKKRKKKRNQRNQKYTNSKR